MLLEIVARGQHDLVLFAPGDRAGGSAMAGPSAISDLDKHQGIPLAHDEIYFTTTAAVVAGHGLQAAGLQPAFRYLLKVLSLARRCRRQQVQPLLVQLCQ